VEDGLGSLPLQVQSSSLKVLKHLPDTHTHIECSSLQPIHVTLKSENKFMFYFCS